MGVACAEKSTCLRNNFRRSSPPPLSIQQPVRSVAFLAKQSRWEYERSTMPRKSEQQVINVLKSRGTNVAHILHKHKEMKKAEERIIQKYESYGVRVFRVSLEGLLAGKWKGADQVVAAGGDGTFLAAAAAITDDTPLIGINTDPVGSEGYLCMGGKNPNLDYIENLVNLNVRWAYRNRIRVTVAGHEKELHLALNDVFVGEDEAVKVSYYEIAIDDGPWTLQKSSGLVLCTGTGSTSWYTSINRIQEEQVDSILEALRGMGLEIPPSEALRQQIANGANERLAFDPTSTNMMYTIREPIFNGTFSHMRSRGDARVIRLRSRCSKASIVLDGAKKIPFNHGTEVIMEIDPQYVLRTVT